ncbi:MAG TPA: hypothetical protein VLC98_13185 [Phnomibacter sp.]|nr:hypothetical protein [Phnomibacter sp.]
MGYILAAILIFIGINFIVKFVIPVVRTTSQVRKQFQSMKEKMEEAQQQRGGQTPQPAAQKPKYDVEGEYIPFEDVK